MAGLAPPRDESGWDSHLSASSLCSSAFLSSSRYLMEEPEVYGEAVVS